MTPFVRNKALTSGIQKHCHVVLGVRTDVEKDAGGFARTETKAQLFSIQGQFRRSVLWFR